MGRSTGTGGPANRAAQFTGTPLAHTVAAAARAVVASSCSARSTGAQTAWSAPTISWVSAQSTPPGPTSTYAPTPSSRSVATAASKRTVSRTLRSQYAGEHTSSGSSTAPVTVETTGMRGAAKVSCPSTSPNASSIGSMRAEWNAWLTRSRLVLRPRAAKCAATASTASSSPETTTDSGPLTAASPAPGVPPTVARCARTSASVARIDTMAPPVGSACIRVPRAATRRAASGSDSTPAMCAAATSPTECPATKSGTTPQDSTSR